MKKTPLTYACELHAALVSVDEAHRAIVVRGFLEGLARSRKTNLRPRIVTAFNDLALAIEGLSGGKRSRPQPSRRGHPRQASRRPFKKRYF